MARMLTAALVLGPLTLVVVWMFFQHKPGWYRPVALDEAGARAARGEAVSTADYVSDRMVTRRPFDLMLRDQAVTRWLAALPTAWSDGRGTLPDQATDPVVRFEEGRVRIAAHYSASGWQAILSVDLTVAVSADGSDLLIAATRVRGGSLPIPRALLRGLFAGLLNTPSEPADASGEPAEAVLSALQGIQSVEELFEGIRLENRFVWFNGRRPFRIDSIHIDAGKLGLRIEPL